MKILAIGNSFSDDAMEYVADILKGMSVTDFFLGNLYIGGCSLSRHYDNIINNNSAYEYRTNCGNGWTTEYNYKLSDALASQNWDYISMQQASGFSGEIESYNVLDSLIAEVRKICGDAPKLVWHMTWAYQGNSTHGDFPKYGCNQMKMYKSITDVVQGRIIPDNAFSSVIPSGTAVQNARTSFIGDNLTRDGFHLSYGPGRYIAGLTYACTLTGKSPADVGFTPDGVDEDQKNVAIEAVINALKDKFHVTQSLYK